MSEPPLDDRASEPDPGPATLLPTAASGHGTVDEPNVDDAGGCDTGWVKPGYELRAGAPDVDDYLALRAGAGLSPKTAEQARGAIAGSWYAVHVVDTGTGDTVGMGRVLGDGGWYFHIVDMAVLPDRQRCGIGAAILAALVERVRREAPPGAYISLLADPPGRPLYRRHGFVETAPGSIGMVLAAR